MSDPLEKKDDVFLLGGGNAQLTKENKRSLNDLEVVLSTKSGRRFIWRIVKKSALMMNAMTGNSQTYFILGQQSIGQDLIQTLFTDRFIGSFRKMQDEALSDERIVKEASKKEDKK